MTARIRDTRIIICIVVWALGAAATSSIYATEDLGALRETIDFPTSGASAAQPEFVLGVLALHSFWYEQARIHFRNARRIDPAFGMTYWGEAMSYDNAFDTDPGTDYEAKGAGVVGTMTALDAKGELHFTDRERGYAVAVQARFAPGHDALTRRRDYGQAMERLVERYPKDDEAQIFAALALMSYPAFDNEDAAHVVLAAAPLEEIFERKRHHPGVLHCLIHAYDSALFAPMGLRAARIYATIAPPSAHALHIPSHIYKHLGMWPEVASANEAAYAASVASQEKTGRPLSTRDFHAIEWLLEADLALGRTADADRLMREVATIEATIEARGEPAGQFPTFAAALRAKYRAATDAGAKP